MKKPDDIKKGLECGFCHECPYDNNKLETVEECARQVHKDALAYITQLESTYSQVSKALCGKENATLDEVLRGVSQLKNTLEMAQAERDAINKDRIDLMTRLAQAERERDVLMWDARGCHSCKHEGRDPDEPPCDRCTEDSSDWEWRGVCKENSKEERQ